MRKVIVLWLHLLSCSLLAQNKVNPYVILISLDGFRYDYVNQFNPPHFREFIKAGASAEAMIPSFPSKTFPNHYTIVTGLYPGHHGLVDNQFYDPALKKHYGMKDPEDVNDPVYYGGTPLWQLVQQNGMKSASYFWVGSEAPVQGRFPDYYYKYNDSTSNEKRVEQALAWLKLPEADRPHFISLYFSLVDTEGHHFGPHSPELKKAVMKADSVLGSLMNGLKSINLPVNVVVVSDHGMLEMKQEESTFIYISKLFNIKDASIVFANGGTQTHIYTNKKDSLYQVLKKQELHYKVYRKEDFPARWSYNHQRSGDLLIVADPGYYIQIVPRKETQTPPAGTVFGAHGFDPDAVKDMRGIFYASGPNIKASVTVPAFVNVHVYPFICRLLGLTAPQVDGDPKVLEGIYRK